MNDKKIDLFAFTNCVFDCNDKKFRPIEPTDYIMTTCDYNYIENVPIFYTNEIMRILRLV